MRDKSNQLPIIGMNTDHTPFKQPDNTYIFALNAVNDTEFGARGTLTNERGTIELYELSGNQRVIGDIPINGTSNIIFATNGSGVNSIGLFENNTYTELLNDSCLNFSLTDRISGEVRVINGCDTVIYFRDSLNPDRRINLSKLDDGFYNVNGIFDCNLIELNPNYLIPNIELTPESAGDLEPGAYAFSIAYLDDEFNIVYNSDVSLFDYVIKDQHNSVRVQFTNIDTRFSYINIYVIRSVSGNGVSTEQYQIETNYPIQSSSFDYTLFNITSDDLNISLDEITRPNVVYETSRVMEQVNNRLVRANLTEKFRDYSIYQQYANGIETRWVAKQVAIDERHQTFMGGESEAFGIVYIHTDGSKSPVFHISCQTTFNDSLGQISGYAANGYSDPHICTNNTYTNPTCADDYWGTLAGNNIQHFKTPDRDVVLLAGATVKRVYGYRFSNITYPPDVVGHMIVKALRDESNKIIVSKGFAGNLYEHQVTGGYDYRGFTYFQSIANESSHFWFMSPELLYKRRIVSGDNFKKIFEFDLTEVNIDTASCNQGTTNQGEGHNNCRYFDGNGLAGTKGDVDIVISASYLERGTTHADFQMQPIERTKYFEYMQNDQLIFESGKLTLNASLVNPVQFIYTQSSMSWLDGTQGRLFYTAICNDREVFCDLSAITYVKTHNGIMVGDTVTFQGDYWISKFNIYNILQEKETNGGWLDVAARIATAGFRGAVSALGSSISSQSSSIDPTALASSVQSVGQSGSSVIGGNSLLIAAGVGAAIGVGLQSFTEIANFYREDQLSDFTELATNAFKNGTHLDCCANTRGDIFYHGEALLNCWVESEIDTSLREKITVCGDVFNDTSIRYLEYVRDKVTTYNEEIDNYVVNGMICPEIYNYNYDYSKKSVESKYYPLSRTYDFCSDCINRYPNRIIYSPVSPSLNIGQGDSYNMVLAGANIDIPAHKGAITDINLLEDTLYINTTQSLWATRPNPQRMNTDLNVVYVDTGDFLSVVPSELTTTLYGTGGNLNGKSLRTPKGLVWVDSLNGKIFNISQKSFDEMSRKGMYQFFRRNSPYTSTFRNNELDIINIAYDNIYDRILLNINYYNNLSGNENDDIEDVNSWENKSFTMSYSLSSDSWISFHSYLPDYMFTNAETFYSSVESKIYKHGKGLYSNFYGDYYDYIIEYIIKHKVPSVLESIHYYGDVYLNKKRIDDTFDRAVVYTDNQSTGQVNLLLAKSDTMFNLGWSNTDKSVIKNQETYKIGSLRDIAINDVIFSDDWADINNQYFIDKVPVNINYNEPEWQLNKLRGHWHGVRLYFKVESDELIRTEMLSTVNLYSNR